MSEEIKEYTYEQAQALVVLSGKTKKLFYRNVRGWTITYSLSPTSATPTGQHRDFPRQIFIKL